MDKKRDFVKQICKEEYERQHTVFNERPLEYEYVFRQLMDLMPRTILDVGAGRTALPSLMSVCGCHVTATDNVRDYWPNGMFNHHFHIIDDDITQTKLQTKFDMVTCISTLEHIKKHDLAVKNMVELLHPGGHLVLTFPYSEKHYVPNVYELPGVSYPKVIYVSQSFSRRELNQWLADNPIRIIDQDYWRCWTGKFWRMGERVNPAVRATAGEVHQLSRLLLRKK